MIRRSCISSELRRAILANVLIVIPTIPFILERLRDVDFRVRKQSIEQIMKEIDIGHLTMDQRKWILKCGFHDR
jgi:hypothetical protein